MSEANEQVVINGESRPFAGSMSLADLLDSLDLDARTVAIELEGEVIPRAQFSVAMVYAGNRVEIVRFVQGG